MTDIKIRLTGSEDFGVAEIELSAEGPVDALNKLKSAQFADLASEAVAQQVLLAKSLKAQHGLTPEPTLPVQGQVSTPAAPAYQSPWGNEPAPPVATGAPQKDSPHPAGQQCTTCGTVLTYWETQTGKKQWKCPQYRYNSQAKSGNGHEVLWI